MTVQATRPRRRDLRLVRGRGGPDGEAAPPLQAQVEGPSPRPHRSRSRRRRAVLHPRRRVAGRGGRGARHRCSRLSSPRWRPGCPFLSVGEAVMQMELAGAPAPGLPQRGPRRDQRRAPPRRRQHRLDRPAKHPIRPTGQRKSLMELSEIIGVDAVRAPLKATSKKRLLQDLADMAEAVYRLPAADGLQGADGARGARPDRGRARRGDPARPVRRGEPGHRALRAAGEAGGLRVDRPAAGGSGLRALRAGGGRARTT